MLISLLNDLGQLEALDSLEDDEDPDSEEEEDDDDDDDDDEDDEDEDEEEEEEEEVTQVRGSGVSPLKRGDSVVIPVKVNVLAVYLSKMFQPLCKVADNCLH